MKALYPESILRQPGFGLKRTSTVAYDPLRPNSHVRTPTQLNFIVVGAGSRGDADANDVCDDQIVTISWEHEPLSLMECKDMPKRLQGRGAKHCNISYGGLARKAMPKARRIPAQEEKSSTIVRRSL